jgi:hypothetical protein
LFVSELCGVYCRSGRLRRRLSGIGNVKEQMDTLQNRIEQGRDGEG